MLHWAAYEKVNKNTEMKIPMVLQTNSYNECILAALTYGCETVVLKKTLNKIQADQRSIERRNLDIFIQGHKTNNLTKLSSSGERCESSGIPLEMTTSITNIVQ